MSRRLRLVITGALCIVAFTLLLPRAPEVEARSAEYARFDVTVELRPDGVLHVTEKQVVTFQDGPFTIGYREIPLGRTDGIHNVRVTETTGERVAYREVALVDLSDESATFNASTVAGNIVVNWHFESTTSMQRTFLVEYDVVGAVRSYPNEDPPNQQIWWTAVSEDLASETPVRVATATIVLPAAVDLASVVLGEDGKDDPTERSIDGKTFTWTRDALGDGDDFIIRLQFPPQVDVAPPSWQAADDERRASEEKADERQAVIAVIFLAVGLVLATGGGASVFGLWYMRGRDPHAGLVADFITQPPDDLPPGAVGTLLDEHANECDIVATLVDLGHRGVIKITDTGTVGPLKIPTGDDFLVELVQHEAPIAPFESSLLRSMFSSSRRSGDKRRLSEVRGNFIAAYPDVKEKLYNELVSRGYFPRSPESTREGWRKIGWIGAVASVAIGLVAGFATSWVALFPAAIGLILFLAMFRISRNMPRKTAAGAEAAAKWRAFRRYLDDIEKYEKVAESQQIFDKYLPYAVAFGLDKSWVAKFANVDAPTPDWFDMPIPAGPSGLPTGDWGGGSTLGIPRTRVGGGGSIGGGGGGGIDLPDIDLPDLQKTSNKAGGGLQKSSSGMMDLLSVAGAIFEIASIFTGGGGRGGSSGGGGGGFR